MDKRLWRAIQKRVPFRVARRLLAGNGFPKGSSWSAIDDKLKSSKILAKADYAGLLASYRETLIATEKSLRIYTLSAKNMAALRTVVASAKPGSSSDVAKAFPYPLEQAELKAKKAGPATIAGKVAIDGGQCLIFSAIEEMEFRVPIPLNQLKQAAGDDYSVVYGIRVERTQTFNAVIVPPRGNKLYVLVDAPASSTAESRRGLHLVVRTAINKMAGSDMLKEPDNLYPVIKPLYNSGEGSVTNFSYTTTTASEKRERMRGAGQCLRSEIAHKTGMAALGGNVQAYEIELCWELPETNKYVPRPELAVHGTYRMTYEKGASVSEALVRKCAAANEIIHVITRLLKIASAASA